MYSKLAETLQWRVDLLIAERFEDLARGFLVPFALYRGDRQIVISSVEDVIQALAHLREDQRRRGVVRMQARLKAVDLPRHGRFRVWLTYVALDAEGRALGQSDAVLYCRETAEGLHYEMADCGPCSVPGLWDEPMKARNAVGG